AVVIASVLEAAMYVGYGAFLGFFPPYAQGIGLNDAQISLVLGAQLATTMVAKPLAGSLSDRVGRKPMILAGLFLCALMLPAVPLAGALLLRHPQAPAFGLTEAFRPWVPSVSHTADKPPTRAVAVADRQGYAAREMQRYRTTCRLRISRTTWRPKSEKCGRPT